MHMKQDYARLKLKCDVVEAKAGHAEFLHLILRIRTLTGIEIPAVSAVDMSSRRNAGKAFKQSVTVFHLCCNRGVSPLVEGCLMEYRKEGCRIHSCRSHKP